VERPVAQDGAEVEEFRTLCSQLGGSARSGKRRLFQRGVGNVTG